MILTFVHRSSGDMTILLMSSAGYFKQLCDESSARHGSFYVTNIMDLTKTLAETWRAAGSP